MNEEKQMTVKTVNNYLLKMGNNFFTVFLFPEWKILSDTIFRKYRYHKIVERHEVYLICYLAKA